MFILKSVELFGKLTDLLMFAMKDDLPHKLPDFRSPEQQRHYQIEHILDFEQFPIFTSVQHLQLVYISINCHHEIDEFPRLLNDEFQLIRRNRVQGLAELTINRFEETSILVFLEETGPFEEQIEGLAVFVLVELSLVDDVDL